MSNYRKEIDLLGKLNIKKDLYYGIHTERAIQNFQISKSKTSDYPEFIKSLLITKKACASANKDIGNLPEDKANMIIQACDEMLNNIQKYIVFFPVDLLQGGAGTSVNMNVNEVIANLALELNGFEKGNYTVLNPNDHVNKSQSTNDVYPTGFRVALYNYITALNKKIEALITHLEEKAIQFKNVLKMGRTQLQDAVPMSLGDEFGSWATNLKEEIKNLQYCRALVLEVNLGGTAIGTGVNVPKRFSEKAVEYLSSYTGVKFKIADNLIEASSDCGAYVMISGGLKRIAVKLSKICNDLRLLSSGPRCGLNEINLPEMQAGSSIMPAKVNPVIPEVVNQVCFKVFGNDVAITFAAEAGQLQLNVMEPVIAQCLFESLELLSNACITLANKCISGITANELHTKKMVFNSIGLITFLNQYIGHHMGDLIGKEAIETGKSIKELLLEKKVLSKKKIDKILSVDNLIKSNIN